MSQSSRVPVSFGSLTLAVDKRLSQGSSSEIVPVFTPVATAFADADATVTVDQIKTGIFTMTPTVTRTLTLPTATLLSSFLDSVGKSIDLVVINSGADTIDVIIAGGTGGSVVGNDTVRDSIATTNPDSGSGLFKIIMTDISSPAYVVYRIC